MQIAFIDSWLRQAVDGSGTAVAITGLERALAARGYRVSRLGPLRSWPQNITARRLLFNLQLPLLLRSLRYDLVVGFDIDGFLYSGRTQGTPYICSVKGVIAEEYRHERGAVRQLLWSLSLLEGQNARRADALLTTSDYCRARIAEHYRVSPQRIGLVPEGIDLVRWRERSRATTVARDPYTVLCVARQYPRKHIADLLHAFVTVVRAEPRARLVIIGDGPEHQALRSLAARLRLGEVVRFLGGLPDDDAVLDWYRRSTVFCLPSVQEGFGIVLLEAMAAGIPIVATTAAAVPEVVPQRRAGILVPPADSQALAAALIELLATPELCAELGGFGSQYVERFSWDRVAAQFLVQVSQLLPGVIRPQYPAGSQTNGRSADGIALV